MPGVKIIFYDKADGTRPAEDFVYGLDEGMQAKMLRAIDRLMDYGPSLRRPYSAPLGGGIFELRAQFGGDISRVLYFFIVEGNAVLTHGFIKKTQKTPQEEIERARRYRAEYLGRSENK